MNFTEKDAFTLVYGQYDLIHKHALWKNIESPQSTLLNKELWENKTNIVTPILFKSFKETGKQKVFLITKAIPSDQPYECHACLPLLSATIFSKDKGKWHIESQNLFLMQEGEYGASPIAHLIQIGLDKYGVSLEYEHRNGESFSKELYLIVPYKKSIMNAFEETLYYDNFNACGWSMQCATFYAKLNFSFIHQDEFYPIEIKRFGTRNEENQHYRAVPVDETSVYQFHAGKYVQMDWKGFPKLDYETSIMSFVN